MPEGLLKELPRTQAWNTTMNDSRSERYCLLIYVFMQPVIFSSRLTGLESFDKL
jgi:hypothetical protein